MKPYMLVVGAHQGAKLIAEEPVRVLHSIVRTYARLSCGAWRVLNGREGRTNSGFLESFDNSSESKRSLARLGS